MYIGKSIEFGFVINVFVDSNNCCDDMKFCWIGLPIKEETVCN